MLPAHEERSSYPQLDVMDGIWGQQCSSMARLRWRHIVLIGKSPSFLLAHVLACVPHAFVPVCLRACGPLRGALTAHPMCLRALRAVDDQPLSHLPPATGGFAALPTAPQHHHLTSSHDGLHLARPQPMQALAATALCFSSQLHISRPYFESPCLLTLLIAGPPCAIVRVPFLEGQGQNGSGQAFKFMSGRRLSDISNRWVLNFHPLFIGPEPRLDAHQQNIGTPVRRPLSSLSTIHTLN